MSIQLSRCSYTLDHMYIHDKKQTHTYIYMYVYIVQLTLLYQSITPYKLCYQTQHHFEGIPSTQEWIDVCSQNK